MMRPDVSSTDVSPKQQSEATLTSEHIETYVADIVRRSKDVETLIAALPTKDDSSARVRVIIMLGRRSDTQVARLEELQKEMAVANAEYKEALATAGTLNLFNEPGTDPVEELLEELNSVMAKALGDGTTRIPKLKPSPLPEVPADEPVNTSSPDDRMSGA